MLSVFRRKPLPDDPLGPPTPGSQDRAPAPPRLDGEMVDVLEADVLKAIRAVTQAIAGANGQVAATKLDIDQIRAAMSGLAAAGRGASAQTTSLAASTEELAATSGEIDAAMGQADTRILDAVETARGANGMIAELARATDEIVGIIDTIAAVARQTNLLALNATIEAARAGAAGRGFAVVASEVKALSVETSNAANDIRSRIGRLRDSAGASIGAVDQVVTVIQGVQPVFGAVRNAVGEQSAAIADLAERAGQASSFVAEVSALAQQADGVAAAATARIGQADQAACAAESLANALGQRFVAVMRQNEIGDRRRFDRFPTDLRAGLRGRDAAAVTRTVDVSRGGVLVAAPEGVVLPPGAPVELDLERIGPVPARVVATSPMGLHCAFGDLSEEARARVGAVLAEIEAAYRPLIEAAQGAARQVEFVLEQAVKDGRLAREQLFDVDYRPVPGTNPQQYETGYLRVFEDLLPSIQEPLLASDSSMTFCLAIDRNGYIPVHNRRYAQPQRASDPAWNAANSRNRRIFDDRAGITAARSTRPFVVQSYARDMGGTVVMMREVDAPIRLLGRHWGGFRTAYRL